MANHLKYKGILFKAVDAVGTLQLVSQWESAYASGDFKRANGIKANIKVNAKWDREKLARSDLPLGKV